MSLYPYVQSTIQLEYYNRKLTENISACATCLSHIISILQSMPVEATNTDKIYANVITYCFSINEIEVKLLLHKFIYVTCKDSEQVLMVCNSLLMDSRNQNPLLRKSALKTLAKISMFADEDLKSQCRIIIADALEEPDSCVKCSVIMSIASIFMDQAFVSLELFAIVVNKLYSLIKHEDALVVFNSLVSLDKILEKEGGVVINKKIAEHLASRLDNFQDLHKTIILKYIDKYRLQNSENLKLEYQYNFFFSSSLSFSTQLPLDLFKYNVDDLLLKSTNQNAEYIYLIFDWIMKNEDSIIDESYLFYESNDPWYLKVIKLSCSLVNFLKSSNSKGSLISKDINIPGCSKDINISGCSKYINIRGYSQGAINIPLFEELNVKEWQINAELSKKKKVPTETLR